VKNRTSRKRQKRLHEQQKQAARNRLTKIALGKIASCLTPHNGPMNGWARLRDVMHASRYHWYSSYETTTTCRICGTVSSGPARLRWMWILKHEEDHIIALGREKVAAVEALVALSERPDPVWGGWSVSAWTEALERVFGPEIAGRRW
jgi:hypothetical protein